MVVRAFAVLPLDQGVCHTAHDDFTPSILASDFVANFAARGYVRTVVELEAVMIRRWRPAPQEDRLAGTRLFYGTLAI